MVDILNLYELVFYIYRYIMGFKKTTNMLAGHHFVGFHIKIVCN